MNYQPQHFNCVFIIYALPLTEITRPSVRIPVVNRFPLNTLLYYLSILNGFTEDSPFATIHLFRDKVLIPTADPGLSQLKAFVLLSHSFLSVLHYHYNSSPAYLFIMRSARILSDGRASWTDYILLHLNNRFTVYALRLTSILTLTFALGQSLQTTSPLNSPLIIHDIPDSFAMDDNIVTKHLSRNNTICLEI